MKDVSFYAKILLTTSDFIRNQVEYARKIELTEEEFIAEISNHPARQIYKIASENLLNLLQKQKNT
jgi:hypothetical protein